MDLRRRDVNGIVVVEVHGKLVGDPENAQKFHRFFKTLLDEGKTNFVVNLRHTPWANSLGIGMLISAYASAKKAGGTLVLAEVADRIEGILAVTKLLLIFSTFYDEEEAVAYLGGTVDGGGPVHFGPPRTSIEDETVRTARS